VELLRPVWGAYQFNGVNSRVSCGNDSSLNITNSLTLEAWFMTVAIPEDNNQFILIKGDTGVDKSYYLYLRGVDDNIWFEVSSTGR